MTQLAALWLKQRGPDWHKAMLTPLLRFGEGTPLSRVHSEYLVDLLCHIRDHGYTRVVKVKTKRGYREKKLEREYSPSAIRRQIRFAHSVFEWGHVRGYLSTPVPEFPKLPRVPELDRSLTRDELARIFDELPRRAGNILRFVALPPTEDTRLCTAH